MKKKRAKRFLILGALMLFLLALYFYLDWGLRENLLVQGEAQLNNIATVSYTHLDVYKRQVLGRIRGVEGTKAKIALQSGQETREVELPRRVTDMQMVMTDMINAKVGYVNIVEFSGSAVDDFKKAIASMESEGAQAIVIDLRGNRGGNISQAMEIADLLLDEGQIAYVMGKEKASITWKSSKSTEYDKPIIILTDEQTEGVSEVFAAALQERGRAQILGKKTMGRAVMTSFFEVPSTGNVVKLVTGRYLSLIHIWLLPAKGKYKVYIIDEVHMLTGSAFNALLKTLEEPPAHVVFILATTELAALPKTVLSRCQRFDFRRIEEGDIAARLEEVAKNVGVRAQKSALMQIAAASDGALRDALTILDQCCSFSSEIDEDLVSEVLGYACLLYTSWNSNGT